MIYLLPLMLERVGLLLIFGFLLSRMRSFRQMIHQQHSLKEKTQLIAVFGAFGILSNYTGIEIQNDLISTEVWQTTVDADGALANTRVLGVVLGGLLGGPLVGTGVGLIAGLHRFTLGGFTAVACGISTIFAGIVTGFLSARLRKKGSITVSRAVLIGIVMECIQMGIILAVAKPYEAALELVQLISIPMITMNGFGTLLFVLMIQSILQEEERTRALQTNKALYIADQTLPFFRQGLNARSSKEAAEIILRHTHADAIAITNKHQVLTHVGAGLDHHVPLQSLSTQLTRDVIERGKTIKARSAEEIQCFHPNCPLQAAIVLPLKVHQETVGTLKLYFTDTNRMDKVEQELAEGLGKLFSTQLEMGEAELQSKLLKDAEIKALQAQVHPHFLFNAINTISSLCRTDPEKARELLQRLGVFFRSNLQGARQTLIPLYKEIEHVEAYLTLEKARFPDKYTVAFDMDPTLEEVLLPPFTLQPLVENAIRHAFPNRKGHVSIRAYRELGDMVLITEDNGIGLPADLLDSLGKNAVKSAVGTGTALHNIRMRMKEIYGEDGAFRIESECGAGTKVILKVPIDYKKWDENHAESFYR
ncbi:sensor histidine kinase [Paenibacillus sp.]|uniref:sensor histidine kinase n=1 Tax=Paenibacillus sp. TaxID=58172 RepID=UPI0028115B09|nr:sensor histidine kinase [Paenibacillus sp.]